jgi:hypothetical protein
MVCAECETAAPPPVCFPQRCQEGQRHVWAGCGNPRIHHMILTFVQLSLGWLGVGRNEFSGLGQKG